MYLRWHVNIDISYYHLFSINIGIITNNSYWSPKFIFIMLRPQPKIVTASMESHWQQSGALWLSVYYWFVSTFLLLCIVFQWTFICIHVFVCTCIFISLGYTPKSGIARSYSNYRFNHVRNFQNIFRRYCHQQCMRVPIFIYFLANTVFFKIYFSLISEVNKKGER